MSDRVVTCAGACGKSVETAPGRLPQQWVSYYDHPICRACHVRRRSNPALKALARAARQHSRRRAAGVTT